MLFWSAIGIRVATYGENISPCMPVFCRNAEGCGSVNTDVLFCDWVSFLILLGFAVELLYGFTAPIKGKGGGERDVLSCLSQHSLAFLPSPHVAA